MMFKVFSQCLHCFKIHRNFTQKDDIITCNLCGDYMTEKYFYLNRNMIIELLTKEGM